MAAATLRPILRLLLPLALLSRVTLGAPFSVFDDYAPPCTPISDPAAVGGFKLWSSPSTWGGGPIPGVGAGQGLDATIPCDTAVLLDVPSVVLHTLDVQGLLQLMDDPSLPLIQVNASFVVVQGQLVAGQPSSHFRQRAAFTLLPNGPSRAEYAFSANAPADPSNPRSLGHKAFAVVGGQVHLHGMPGGSSTPAWCQLAGSVHAGDKSLVLDCDASGWPVGFFVALASTDYYNSDVDVVQIQSVSVANGQTTVVFSQPLQYNHFGERVSDGFGGWLDERGEVALLNRTIKIQGLHEPGEHFWEGGHFMVFMTSRPQFIEGVEFAQMGQQGRLGRYNIHFHVCGDQAGRSVVRKNVMRDSKQRCVVVHMTDSLVVEENVAFHTRGHCFIVEEGGERNNTFLRNLGIWQIAVDVPIPSATDASKTDETDQSPASFWISNPNNHLIGNRAAGSDDSGFWFELRDSVRGLSLLNPHLSDTVPRSSSSVGSFRDNVAHSSAVGFRLYPRGMAPRFNATVSGDGSWWSYPVDVTFSGFFSYKCLETGFFIHDTDHVTLDSMAAADNIVGVQLFKLEGVRLRNATVVALTANLGNPWGCDQQDGGCAPVQGCQYPLSSGSGGREVGWGGRTEPIYGALFSQSTFFDDATMANAVLSARFSGFSPACRVQAAVAVGDDAATYWNSGNSVQGLTFAQGTNKVYFAPRVQKQPGSSPYDHSENQEVAALRDADGSLLGSPGFVVANTRFMRPPIASPAARRCRLLPASSAGSAVACAGLCFRSVQVSFYETLPSIPDSQQRKAASSSSVRFTRTADLASHVSFGGLPDIPSAPDNPFLRRFTASLLSGFSYIVEVLPRPGSQALPANITVGFADGGGSCSGGVTLRFPPRLGRQWQLLLDDSTMPSPCPGWSPTSSQPAAPLASFRYVCSGMPRRLQLELQLAGALPAAQPLTLLRSAAPLQGCVGSNISRVLSLLPLPRLFSRLSAPLSSVCGLLPPNAVWHFDQSGAELHPQAPGAPAFFNPRLNDDAWARGAAPLAFQGWDWWLIHTQLAPPNNSLLTTYYFRTTFSVRNAACLSHLLVDLLVDDGVVLFLNDRELRRFNMPDGPLDNSSAPLSNLNVVPDDSSRWLYSSASIPLASSNASLVEGENTIAAEVHVAPWAWEVAWGLRLSASSEGAPLLCHGQQNSQEVCDGVDNDGDGLIDVDPQTKQPLQRPCATACGTGTAVCWQGAYRNCSAPPAPPETCNGLDDDCDGMVDNGPFPLGCPTGSTCFQGACLPVGPLTAPQPALQCNASNWAFQATGANVPKLAPQWKTGALAGHWANGTATFGYFPDNPSWSFPTALPALPDGAVARYFVTSFQLTQEEAANAYGFTLSVRRADGVVVHINGQELFRDNMPSGPVGFSTTASGDASSLSPWDEPNALEYAAYPGLRASRSAVRPGTNWVAVELHQASWTASAVLDVCVARLQTLSCAALPGAPAQCVLLAPANQTLFQAGSTWRFLDASRPLPPAGWMLPGFDDSAWPQGPSPIGWSTDWQLPTEISPGDISANHRDRVTYYFRASFPGPADRRCFSRLVLRLMANDGAVVYLNGKEAARFQLPRSAVSATTLATQGGPWAFVEFPLSAGWLLASSNAIAVELHQSADTTGNYFLEAAIVGEREGQSCTPLAP